MAAMAKREEINWKAFAGVAAVGAGIVARKALQTAWKAYTGKAPPANPENPEVRMLDAVGWAVASGAVVGIARMLAGRAAAARWRKSTGQLPPGLRPDTNAAVEG